MTQHFQYLSIDDIVLYTASEDGDVTIVEDLAFELRDLLNQITSPVYYLGNLSQIQHVDMDSLSKLTAVAAWGENSPYRHPIIKEVLLVTQLQIIASAARNLGTEMYGNIPVSVFESLDEALAYARSHK